MQVITVREPWAWLMFHPPEGERKDIENRKCKWGWLKGKTIGIHAASKLDPGMPALADYIMQQYGLDVPREPEDYPLRYIIGVVEVADIVREHNSRWFTGPVGYVLQHPILLANPIRAIGRQYPWQAP